MRPYWTYPSGPEREQAKREQADLPVEQSTGGRPAGPPPRVPDALDGWEKLRTDTPTIGLWRHDDGRMAYRSNGGLLFLFHDDFERRVARLAALVGRRLPLWLRWRQRGPFIELYSIHGSVIVSADEPKIFRFSLNKMNRLKPKRNKNNGDTQVAA